MLTQKMRENAKLAALSVLLVALPVVALAQTADRTARITQSGDDAQRQANNQHDWWLVSTVLDGRAMHRF